MKRILSYIAIAFSSIVVPTQMAIAGSVADITSDCTGGCSSITYSGAPGSAPSGNAVHLVSRFYPIWTDLSAFGLSGDWISYGQTGTLGSGQAVGTVDFTVNYAVNPAWNVNRAVFNVLADDFAQVTASPKNFGPMPSWDAQVSVNCSSNPPGCKTSQFYTQTLSPQELSMFLSDNQMTFTLTQLIDDTPFGFAFDIQLFSDPVPEPSTLGLVGIALAFCLAGLRHRRRVGSI